MGYIVVRRKTVKKSTPVAHKSSSTSSSRKGTVPKRPKVTTGPRAMKTYTSGRRLVIRFFVTQHYGTRNLWRRWVPGPWYVVDSLTWRTADGTETKGYRKKEEAVSIAREYRDEYGAYCKSPF